MICLPQRRFHDAEIVQHCAEFGAGMAITAMNHGGTRLNLRLSPIALFSARFFDK